MAPSLQANQNGINALKNRPDEVKAALEDTTKTLYDVANDLDIFKGGDTKQMADIATIVKDMTPAQQAEIHAAVLAALGASRDVEYSCTIKDPAQVLQNNPGTGPKVNVAPSVGDKTQLTFTPVKQ